MGMASDTATPLAVAWPALLIVMTYVSVPVVSLAGAIVIVRSADVDPPPPPVTTVYVTLTVAGLPDLSVAITANFFVPIDDVAIGFRSGPCPDKSLRQSHYRHTNANGDHCLTRYRHEHRGPSSSTHGARSTKRGV